MNILIVEDRGAVLYPLTDMMESLGHEVLRAFNVAQARALWNGGKNNIACLIVDLNIPADLSANQEIEDKVRKSGNTQWQAIAGWIWLEQEGLVGKSSAPDRPKIIVFSGYLDVLRTTSFDENAYPGIKFVRKGPGAAQNLRDCIRAIAVG
jgi:CheY-like chemotaxis protein